MIGLGDYSLYMCFVAVLAALANIRLIRVVTNDPCLVSRGSYVLMLYQTTLAVVQLLLWLVLCPRTVFVDGYFGVAFDGLAYYFDSTFQVLSFAFLVFLTTNNVVTTAVSLYERRMLLMGRKITVIKVLMFLAICSVPSLVVTVLLMLFKDWTKFTFDPKKYKCIGYKLTTPRGQIVMGVTAACPVIVALYAIFVSWEAKRLLSSRNRTAIKAMKKMRTTIREAFLVHAAIPLLTGLTILAWYLKHIRFIQGPPSFEYLLFGSGPLLLHLQALITCKSIGRYRLAYITASFLCIFFIDCACSITISAVYFTLLIGYLSLRLFFP